MSGGSVPTLGSRVSEQFSGIDGTVVAVEIWMHGINRCAIARDGVDHNGQPWDLFWCDVSRVEEVEP